MELLSFRSYLPARVITSPTSDIPLCFHNVTMATVRPLPEINMMVILIILRLFYNSENQGKNQGESGERGVPRVQLCGTSRDGACVSSHVFEMQSFDGASLGKSMTGTV